MSSPPPRPRRSPRIPPRPRAFYNDINPYAAQWTRNLISAGLIPPGDVSTLSIKDIDPDALLPYTSCHFFCGVNGWPAALRLAGWLDSSPVWTGSPPCQPFSISGSGHAQSDPRHLWPAFFRLISLLRPPVVFGEQVANAITHGWLDEVACDMESAGYAFAATVLSARSVGAPHERDRLWFVAHSNKVRCDRTAVRQSAFHTQRNLAPQERKRHAELCALVSGMQPSWPAGPGGVGDIPPAPDGLSSSMEELHAYGNSIVVPLAEQFIRAYMDTLDSLEDSHARQTSR